MTTLEKKCVEVAYIVEKMVETHLRWSRHVERRSVVDFIVRGVDQM